MKNRKFLTAVMAVAVMAAVMGNPMEARAADFDPVYYAQTYPDVAAAVGSDAEALFNHYVSFGQAEGRIPYAGALAGEQVNGIADTAATEIITEATPTVGLTRGNFPWFVRQHDDCVICDYMEGKTEVITYGATEDMVKQKLLELKEIYPEGTYLGYGCGGFESKIKTALYGPASVHDPVKPTTTNPQKIKGKSSKLDPSKVRVGDVIRTTSTQSPNGHVFVVFDHDDWGVTAAEANWNWDQKAHWSRRISWEELEKVTTSVTYYLY